MTGGLYEYIEYIEQPFKAQCVQESNGKVTSAHYHQFEVTKTNKNATGDWEATLDGKTVKSVNVYFGSDVTISEWGEATGPSDPGPCPLSWSAAANINGWASYRVGKGGGWHTIERPSGPAVVTGCPSGGRPWSVGQYVQSGASKYHFTVNRS
jgi:hypothetical protein